MTTTIGPMKYVLTFAQRKMGMIVIQFVLNYEMQHRTYLSWNLLLTPILKMSTLGKQIFVGPFVHMDIWLTTYPPLWTTVDIWLTTQPPPLIHVVFECPLKTLERWISYYSRNNVIQLYSNEIEIWRPFSSKIHQMSWH